MNRRNFLSLFSAGVAGIALEQAIPLGRVWSFPKKIVIARTQAFSAGNVSMGVESGVGSHRNGFSIAFDVRSASQMAGMFVVSRVHPESEKVELYSAEQRLVIRGV